MSLTRDVAYRMNDAMRSGKRDGWWTAFVSAVLALAAAWCFLVIRFGGPPCPEPPPPGAPPPYITVYTEAQAMRAMYRLRNEDLAAIGCSQECAERVLKVLVDWSSANWAKLEAVGTRKTHRELQRMMRRVNVGPRDEAVLARVRELKRAYADALRRERQIRHTLPAEVEKELSYTSFHMWQALRRNHCAGFRFAPWLRAWQERALKRANRIYQRRCAAARDDAAGLAAWAEYNRTIAQTLSPAQKDFLKTVKTNQSRCTLGVFKADETVLPLPPQLRSHDPPEHTLPDPPL